MIEWVDKKKRIILCTECKGSGKMLDVVRLAYSLGMNKQLKPCWVCEGTGTLSLGEPVNTVTLKVES